MTMLRDLLTTWENWSARDTLTRALANVTTEDSWERGIRSLADMPTASALDALRDGTELIELLTSWQWQAMYVARCEGASWEEIGTATRTTAQKAFADYAATIDRQERVLGREVTEYRGVL